MRAISRTQTPFPTRICNLFRVTYKMIEILFFCKNNVYGSIFRIISSVYSPDMFFSLQIEIFAWFNINFNSKTLRIDFLYTAYNIPKRISSGIISLVIARKTNIGYNKYFVFSNTGWCIKAGPNSFSKRKMNFSFLVF